MKILLIHGIGQDPNGEDLLLEKWRELLFANATEPDLFHATDIKMAFYADILSAPPKDVATISSMGALVEHVNGTDSAENAFVEAGLRQIVGAVGIKKPQIEAAADEVEREVGRPMGTAIGRALVGVIRVIERLEPRLGQIGVRLLQQAYIYLNKPQIASAIDARIRKEMERKSSGAEKFLVVSHSLGTVIAYKILRELSKQQQAMALDDPTRISVPLLITMGSPLSIVAIRNKLEVPLGRPPMIESWWNYFDIGDLVTLGQGLTSANFGSGVENVGDIDNTNLNAHGIEGYLSQAVTIARLENSLRLG